MTATENCCEKNVEDEATLNQLQILGEGGLWLW